MTPIVEVGPHEWRLGHFGGPPICTEGPEDIRICFNYVKQIRAAGWTNGTVAHVGTGFSVAAWMLGPAFDHTMYDLYDFSAYLPPYVPPTHMIVGDYQDTMGDSRYDIIIFDYAEPLNRPLLEAHLNPAGLLIVGGP